ncbi:hypothetical protein H4I95_09632 [Botrytis cinerea]
MHYSVSKLLIASFIVCGQASTTSSILSVTTLISVPTSSYSSKSSSTTIYLTSTVSFGVSSMSTTASSGVSSGTYSSSRTSTSGTISSVISPITSSTSGSTLHTFTPFSLSHSGIFTSQMSELGSILSNGYQSDSTFSSVSPATTFPSDFSILSSVSSSDPTTSTTSSTSSATSCSATPSNTNPCPELQLVGNDPEPLEEGKPITDEKGMCDFSFFSVKPCRRIQILKPHERYKRTTKTDFNVHTSCRMRKLVGVKRRTSRRPN